MADRFDVGDIIKMKKPHPCGSQEWEIIQKMSRISSQMYGLPGHRVWCQENW